MIFLLSLLLLSSPVHASEPNCDDRYNLGQRGLNICSYKDYLKSKKGLSKVLEADTLKEWNKVSHEVCSQVWKLNKGGSIYPLMVNQCNTRMNNYLYLLNKTGLKGVMTDQEKLK